MDSQLQALHSLLRKLLEDTVPFGWNLSTTHRNSQQLDFEGLTVVN